MDAATLYMVLTMQDGTQTTATFSYETVRDCEAHVEMLRLVERADPQSPIRSYRCERRRGASYYLTCDWPAVCGYVGPYTREGCSTRQWLVHMRDRDLTAHCHEPYTDTDKPEKIPDGFDMRGQPGQK